MYLILYIVANLYVIDIVVVIEIKVIDTAIFCIQLLFKLFQGLALLE